MATTELAIHLTDSDIASVDLEFYDANEERGEFFVLTIATANSKVKWLSSNVYMACDVYQNLGHLIATTKEKLRKNAKNADDELTEVMDRGRGDAT